MSLPSSMFRRIAGRRRAIRGLLGWLALAGLSAACSPEFNWRETRSLEQGFSVLLPGRPASMSREIDLNGLKVDMTMTGARVDRALFTVGTVRLEAAPDMAATHAKALSAMRVAMLRNLGAEPQPGVPVRVGLVDLSGTAKGAVDAIAVEARGQVTGEPVIMQAVFVAHREQLWQAVAIVAPAQAQQARTMLDSFRLLVP
ncbi:MAG: hypothetical protein KGR68_00320 [Betaproteobacteria bacterium]|nr:hypothetical protein [Betaproteobacteria bacterium]